MMRRFIAALLLWLALIAPAAAAIGTPTELGFNVVASGTNNVVITTGATSSAGSMIVVVASAGTNSGNDLSSVTDSNSSTYTVLANTSTGRNIGIAVCYSCPSLASGGTITATYSGTTAVHGAHAFYVANMATSSALDVTGTTQTGSATSATSTATGTLATSDELIVGAANFAPSDPGTVTPGGSFSCLGAAPGTQPFLRVCVQVVASTTSVAWAPSWVNNVSYRTQVYALKGVSTGGASAALLGVGQ